LGYAEMFANYEWFETYLEKLAAVTPEDVQRAAQLYFGRKNRVVGTYIPTGNGTNVTPDGENITPESEELL
jgi:predicted Zn-dependent peptidase